MQKKILLMLSVLLVMITSVAYSALSTSLSITSEVKFRVLADIRVNSVALENSNGGLLAYESEYSKNTVSNGFTLPTSGSSISYRVHIDNAGDVDYSIYDILKTTNNNGLNVAVSGYNIRDVIPAKTSVDLVLTYTTSSPSENIINVVNTFDFKRVFYVTYETGTQEVIPQQIKYQGVNLALTNTQPTKNGYTFSKWNTKSDGSGVNYNSGASYTVDDDVTLYARYNLATYNINYVLNGGTNNANNPSTYTIESNNITLADATKTGYTFKGWTGNGTTTPTKNLVLPKGSYGDKTFTANFKDETDPEITVTSQDGTVNYLENAQTIDAAFGSSNGTIAYKINATDEGSGIDTIEYAITNSSTVPTTGWSSTTNGNHSDSKARGTYYLHVKATDQDGNEKVVTTKLITIRFRVAYYDYFNASTTVSENQYYTGTALTSRTPSAHSGYSFDGWYNSTALTTKTVNANTSYTPTTSIQLYGKWTPVDYAITYALNNGTNNSNNPDSYNIESENITLAAPSKTLTFKGNYNATSGANAANGTVTIGSNTTKAQAFAGWTGSNGTTAQTTVTIPTGSIGDKSYTAHWTAVAGTVPTVTRTGYTCGWSTSSTGTTIEYASGGTFPASSITEGMSSTVNLYAVCNPNTYTVTANANGGSISSTTGWTGTGNTSTKQVTYDSTYGTLPTATRTGYTFAGWTNQNRIMGEVLGYGKVLRVSNTAHGYTDPDYVFNENEKIVFDVTLPNNTINSVDVNDVYADVNSYTISGSRVYGTIAVTQAMRNKFYPTYRYKFIDINAEQDIENYTINKFMVLTEADTKMQIASIHDLYALWSINNPATPTITGGATKIYGSSATTLTCSTATNYTGATKYYSFGYATSDGGTPSNWTTPTTTNTLSIGAQEYVGQRWYSCRVYATDGTQTTSTVASATTADTEMTINNAKITWDVNTCDTFNGTSPAYVRKGTTGVYTGIRNATTGTIPTASKTGYKFNGWYDGSTQVIHSDGTIVAGVSNWTDSSRNWLISQDKTLKASCTPNSYIVTANANGGTIPSTSGWTGTGATSTKLVTYDSTYGTLPTPTKAGYDFAGWKNTILPDSDLVNSTKWQRNQNVTVTKTDDYVQVIYNQANSTPGYIINNQNTIFEVGKKYTITTEIKGIGATGFIVNVYGDNVSLPAVSTSSFTKVSKTFTYTNNNQNFILIYGGTAVNNGFQVKYLQIQEGEVATDYDVTSSTVVAQPINHTLMATWTPATYTVTAKANGGSIPSTSGWTGTGNTATKSVTYLSTYGTLPTPTRTGYTFAGWNGKNLFDPDTMEMSNTTHASGSEEITLNSGVWDRILHMSRWIPTPNTTYTLVAEITTNTFDKDMQLSTDERFYISGYNGDRTIPAGFTGKFITTFTTRSDYSGVTIGSLWFNTSNTVTGTLKMKLAIYEGTNKTEYEPYYIASTTQVTTPGNHDINARWVRDGYTITYSMNNGVNGNNPTVYNIESPAITLAAPSKTLTFKGNYNSTSGANAASGQVTIGSNTTAAQTFAGWTGSNGNTAQTTVTIPTGSTGNKSYTAHWTAVAPASLPTVTRTGYTCGWSTSSTGTTIQYASGATNYPTSLITEGQAATVNLYAVCNPHILTVRYHANGATKDSSGQSVNDLLQTETLAYNGTVARNWPTDYQDPYGFKLVRPGYTADGKYHIGSASSTNTINQDAVSAETPVTTIAETLGVLNNLNAGNTTVDIYAGWTPNTYTVVYNNSCDNTKSGSMANSTYTYDTNGTLRTNAFTCNTVVTYDYNGATGGNSNATSTATSEFLGWTVGAPNLLRYRDLNNKNLMTINTDGTLSFDYQNTDDSGTRYANFFYNKNNNLETNTNYVFVADIKSLSSINVEDYNGMNIAQPNTGTQLSSDYQSVHYTGVGLNYHNTKTISDFSSANNYALRGFMWIRAGTSRSMTFRPMLFKGTYNGIDLYYYDEGTVRNLATSGTINLYADWTYETPITLPTPTKTGYTFQGWYSDSTLNNRVGGGGDSYTPSVNRTLYAKWTPASFTVTAKANGGSISSTSGWSGTGNTATKSVTYLSTYGTLPTVARNGYTFNGWNGKNLLNYNNLSSTAISTGIEVDSNGNISDTSPTSDTRGWGYSYNSQWRESLSSGQYTLSVNFSTLATDATGDTRFVVRNSSDQELCNVNVKNKAFESCTFTIAQQTDVSIVVKGYDGVYKIQLEKGSTATTWEPYYITSSTQMTTPFNHDINARWTRNNYTITYGLNNGTVSTANPTTYHVESSAITLNNPTKTLTFKGNYNATSGANAASGQVTIGANTTQAQTFAGWSGTGITGNSTSVTIPTGSTGNRSYTAHWTAVAGTVPTVTRTGYTCGWSTSSTGTTIEIASGGSYATSRITEGMGTTVNLYAVCTPYTYSIKYMDGDTQKGTSIHSYNIAKNLNTISSMNMSRSGYTFSGWSTSADTVATTYTDGQSVTNLSSTNGATITLYAVWQRNANFYTGVENTANAKYSHTSNIDDTGKKLDNYDHTWGNANITGTDRGNTSQAHVVTISGAESLIVDVYYNGEASVYDWVSIWKGSHPTYNASNNSTSEGYVTLADGAPNNTNKFGGAFTKTMNVNGNTLANIGHSRLIIPGDTVTFSYRSDGSQIGDGYGYYAVVTAKSISTQTATQYYNPAGSGTYKLIAPTQPSKNGYTAAGWRTDTNAGTGSTGTFTTSANEYYGVYTRTASFYSGLSMANEATATQYYNSVSYKYSLTTPSTATAITNWTFDGWRFDQSADVKDHNPGSTITSSNLEYFAIYSRTFTLNYNANGGIGAMTPTTQLFYLNTSSTQTYSKSVTLKNNEFTRDGYDFKGWRIDNSDYPLGSIYNVRLTYDAVATKTAYAQWASNTQTYNIIYDANNGTFGSNTTNTVQYKSSVRPKYSHTPNVSDGGVDSGTYGGNLAINDVVHIPGATKLHVRITYATEANYDYVYVFDGVYSGSVTKNMSQGQLKTYNSTSNGAVGTDEFDVNSDTLTFSFYSDGGVNYYGYYAVVTAVEGDFTETISGTYAQPTRAGYTFNGWNTKNDGTGTLYENEAAVKNIITSTDITLYAKWTPNTYQLTINPQGGTYNSTTSNSTKTMTYDSSNNNDIGVPTRSGYTFDGWYIEANSKANQLFNNTGKNTALSGYFSAAYSTGVWKKASPVTVYAHWSKAVSSTTNSVNPTSYIYDGTAKSPTETVKDGSTTLTNGTDYTVAFSNNTNIGTATATITGKNVYNATTKAYYTGTATVNYYINNATLIFDKGSCTSTSGTTTLYTYKGATKVYTGIRTTASPNAGTIPTASKSGYTFQGWYTASSGGSKVLNANGTFSGTAVTNYTNANSWQTVANQTLYAQCSKDSYSITYSMNNGTNNSNNPSTYTVESAAITLAAPSKTLTFKGNYNSTSGTNAASGQVTIGSNTTQAQTFAGWTGSNGSTAQTSVTIAAGSTGNKSYTAHWTAVAGTVPTVTRTGYTCGWSTSSTGTTIEIASGGSYATSRITEGMAATVNLYAVCVDNIAPTIVSTTPTTTLDLRNYVDFNATDAGTGVSGYNITSTNTAPTTWIPVVNAVAANTETKYFGSAAWARVFHQNNHWGEQYFANKTEAKSSSTIDKYSVLDNIANYKANNKWELLLEYPELSASQYNRWTQTANPVTDGQANGSTITRVAGYTSIHTDWSGSFGGLEASTSSSTLMDGSTGHSDWCYAIGVISRYLGGMPGNCAPTSTANLWARIDNLSTTTSANLTRRIGDIAADGTYYVWVKDAAGNTNSTSITINKVDTTKPTATITSTNNVATSQTATLTLGDNKAISKYYFGSINLPNEHNPTYTTVSNTPTSSTQTSTVSSEGTYYLSVVDVAGNRYYVAKNFYKTTLNANGGSVSPAYVITMEGNSYTLPNPTRTGYDFAGWYTNSELTTAVTLTSGKYAPNASATLYAKWTPASYTLTANANGGSIPSTSGWSGTGNTSTKSVTYLSTYGTLPTPTRSGYTFSGWTSDNIFENGDTLSGISTAGPKDETVKYNGSTSVKTDRAWQGIYLNLKKLYDEGKISIGDKLTFSIYYKTDFTLTKNTTFTLYRAYASNPRVNVTVADAVPNQWHRLVYTITVDETSIASTNARIEADYYEQSDYTFAGNIWFAAPQIEIGESATGYTPYYVTSGLTVEKTSNHTIKANWTRNNYSITYTLNNGTVSTANPTTYHVESSAITLNNPTKTLTFKGNANATSGANAASGTVSIGSNTAAAQTFAGWTGSNGNTAQTTVTIPSGSTGDKSYTAHWTAVAGTVPTVTRNGYTCGWNRSSSGTTIEIASGGTFPTSYISEGMASTVNLYAVCTPNKIHLTLDPSPGTGGTTDIWYYYGTSRFYSNAACTTEISAITRPTRTGYTLVNYHGDGTSGGNNGEKYIAYNNVEFASDLATDIYKDATMYASWAINNYDVTFDNNYLKDDVYINTSRRTSYNSSGTAPTSKTEVEDETAANGYYVELTMADGTSGGPYYAAGSQLPANKTYTWSAEIKTSKNMNIRLGHEQGGQKTVASTTSWQRFTHTFTTTDSQYKAFTLYLGSGSTWAAGDKVYIRNLYLEEGTGSQNFSTSSKQYNSQLGTLPTVTRAGYTFEGWFTDPVGGTEISSTTTVPANNVAYYAHWTPNKYYLDLNGRLDGTGVGYIRPHGTADIYINGVQVSNDVSDYYSQSYTGSTYEVKDIKANAGYTYDGVYSGTLTGTIGSAQSTVVLQFSTNTYQITYGLNNGTLATANPSTYTVSSEDITLNNPTKSLTFVGHANATSGANAASGTVSIGSNTTKAQTFAGWSGTGLSSNTVNVTIPTGSTGNRSYTAHWTAVAGTLPTVTRTGYTCGWNTSSTGTTIQYASGGTYPTTAISEGMSTTVNLYAVCTPASFTVTAKANGGSISSTSGWSGTGNTATKSVTYLSTYGTLPTVARNGYTFNGWNGKNLMNLDVSESLPSNTDGSNETSRIFTTNTYVKGLAFNNYYNPACVSTLTIAQNSIEFTARSGYGVAFPIASSANKTYTLSFDTNGTANRGYSLLYYKSDGTFISFTSGGIPETHITKTFTTPANTYYLVIEFYGSDVSENIVLTNIQLEEGSNETTFEPYYITSATQVTTPFNHDINARWTRNDYSITYALNNGTVSTANPTTYHAESSAITLNNPTKTLTFKGNYNATSGANAASGTVTIGNNTTQAQTFAGWSGTGITGNSTSVTIPTGSTGNRSYTAHWTAVAGTVPTVTRTGYTCGWSTSSTGTTIEIASGGSYATSRITEGMSTTVNLYAVCTPNTYTIGYTMNGGPNPSTKPTSGTYDADVQISNPGSKTFTVNIDANGQGATIKNASGTVVTSATATQTFAGWTSTTMGSNAKTGTGANPSTAWNGSSTKNTYFKNLRESGTVTMVANWNAANATLPNITKTGYTCGYATSDTGSIVYNSGASYATSTTGSSVTLYAKCTINSYTLTINPNGGTYNSTTSNTTVTQNYGTTYNVGNNPTKTGYVFGGWKLTSGRGNITYYQDAEKVKQYIINSSSATQPDVYNNNGNGAVTHSIISDSTSSTGYSLKITTNGTANPEAGGFINNNLAVSGAIYYHKIVAKVPTGYSLKIATNMTGVGYGTYWVTDNAGTGNWKTYIYAQYAGYNGPFSTFGHVYASGSDNTSVTWYINESTMYRKGANLTETQASNIIFGFADSNATLTAEWNQNGIRVTWDTQNGAFTNSNYWNEWRSTYRYTFGYTDTKVAPYYISSSDYDISRSGYTFLGWYTSANGGTQVFDSTGKLNASVSGYSDANRIWQKYDANVTLYAHWSKAVSSTTNSVSPTSYIYDGGAKSPTPTVKDGSTTLTAGTDYTVSGNSNTNVGTYSLTISGANVYNSTTKAYYTGSTTLTYYINNATLTFDKGSCTSTSGTTTLYTRKNATAVYTGIRETTTTGTIPTASKSGYTFNGWYTASSGGSKVLNANGTFTGTAVTNYTNTNSWNVTANQTLYAQCGRDSYSITYSMNNGTNNSNNPSTYTVESAAITLAAPSKTLTFVGNYNATSGANAASGTVSIGSNTAAAQTFAGWTGSNGTTAQTNVTISSGSTGNKSYTAHWTAVAGATPTVTRTGYTCGWNRSSTGTTIEIASGGNFPTSYISEGMSSTVNLYAVCTPKTYTLTINPNGGLYSNSAGTSTKTMTYDSTNNNDIGTPTRNGYTFDGWYTAATNGTQVYGSNGRNVNASSYWTAAYSSGKWKYDGNLTVYAHWTEKTYTLTINPNGGSLDGSTSTVTRNLKYSDVSNITTPTRTGYTFNGWSELENTRTQTHAFSNMGTYNNNGNGVVTISSQSKSTDNPLTGMTNEYKIINSGSAASSPGLGGFYRTVNATASSKYVHVFVAKLPAGYYFHYAHNNLGTGSTVQWLTSNEGTGSWKTYAYQVNAGTGTLSSFGHIYASQNIRNTWGIASAETGSYTAYLAYSNIYNITSNANGIGQYDGTATLTASWTANTYTVTANANGGSIASTTGWTGTGNTATKSNTYDSAYGTLPSVSRTGYTFDGWYNNIVKLGDFADESWVSEANGSYVTGHSEYMATKNKIAVKPGTTLYSNIRICGIYTYDASGNYIKRESSYSTTHPISSNAAYIMIEIKKENGDFNYYVNNLVISEYPQAGSVSGISDQLATSTVEKIPQNHSIYARWTPNTHTVAYSCTENGGTGTIPSAEVEYNTTISLPSTGCSKSGFTFIGWNTNKNSTTVLSAGEAVMGTDNVTLYAIYRKTLTATFNDNGSTVSPTSGSCYVYNKGNSCQVTAPSVTLQSGFTLIGFNTNNTDTTNNSNYNTSTNKLTISANGTWYPITQAQFTGNFHVTDSSAATSSSPSASCYRYNGATSCNIVAPTLTAKSGYTVLGWANTEGATSAAYASGATISLSSNRDFYSVTKASAAIVITFDRNTANSKATSQTPSGGTASTATTVTASCEKVNGATSCSVTSPTMAVEEGHHVVGYNTSATATSSSWNVNTAKSVSANATYYAITAPNTYQLTINPNGGTYNSTTSNSTKTMTFDSKDNNDIGVPTKNGYVFDGWYTAATGGTQIYGSNGRNVSASGYWSAAYNTGVWKKPSAVTVYAHWKLATPPLPTINGGTTRIYASAGDVELTCNDTINMSSYPSGAVKYYSFGYDTLDTNPTGWSDNKWTQAQQSNTYKAIDDGQYVVSSDSIGTRYYACKVYVSTNTESSAVTIGTTKTVLTVRNAKITFNVNGCGTISGTDKVYVKKGMSNVYVGETSTSNGTIPSVSDPSGTKTFGGWYFESTQVINASKVINASVSGWTDSQKKWLITEDKTLTAHCSSTISYNYNEATTRPANPGTYDVSSPSITLINPTKVLTFHGNTNGVNNVRIGNDTTKAQDFAGWSGTGITGNSTSVTIPTGSTGARSYTAHWTAAAGTLPTVDLDGYTCKWNTKSNGTGKDYASGGTFPTSDISESMESTVNLYAICTQSSYTITASPNGGSIATLNGWTASGDNATKLIPSGGTYGTLPTVTAPTGKVFVGWYTSGGTQVTSTTQLVANNSHYIYAHYADVWAENIGYSRTFGNVVCSDAQCAIDQLWAMLSQY